MMFLKVTENDFCRCRDVEIQCCEVTKAVFFFFCFPQCRDVENQCRDVIERFNSFSDKTFVG